MAVSYRVLRDGSLNLALEGPLEEDWNPTNDINLSSFVLSPIISYRISPTGSNPNNLGFKLTMRNQNGAERLMHTFGDANFAATPGLWVTPEI